MQPTESFVDAALLGLIQGLTEFLPVSSSGHLAIGQRLLGHTESSLGTIVLLHAGTLLATLLVFRGDLAPLLRSTWRAACDPRHFRKHDEDGLIAGILIATLPTAVIGLLLKDELEALASQLWTVGFALLATAVLLGCTKRELARNAPPSPSLTQALWIGIAQGLAVMPGVSRSGSTIAMAIILGISGEGAFRFSFLLSLPAITGAMILSLRDSGSWTALSPADITGVTVAFFSGLAALLLLRGLVSKGKLWLFSLYLLPLGAGVIAWDLLYSL